MSFDLGGGLKKIFFFGLLFFFGYLFVLHHQITSKFEGRRWNLPSRIYSDSFSLFSGQVVTAGELRDRLRHLSYHEVDSPKTYGQYSQNGTFYEIFLHSFDYPHHKFEGHRISFYLIGNRISQLRNLENGRELEIISLEPELIASIFDEKMEDRTFVTLEKVPDLLEQAVVLIEDERFYEHIGIDFFGILRALLVNISEGGLVQGGSTITQQLVKNYFLHHRKTLVRKINEMFMALLMELRYSKKEILESYLNEIYFAQRGAASVSGVQEAAQFYFSKNIDQVDAAEGATLAALVKSPGLYSPSLHPKKAKERRNLVLKKLFESGMLEKKDYEKALQVSFPIFSSQKELTHAPYFVEFVKRQLKEQYSQDILESEGIRIFTTLDMEKQRAAERAVQTWLNTLEKDRPYLKKKAGEGKSLEAGLIAMQPETGFIQAYVGGRDFTKNQFDHISLAKRQPGSVFKPFVYATALDPENHSGRQWTLASILPDEELSFSTPQGKWSPKNYDGVYHGKVRLREALERSYNVSTTWLANQIDLKKIIDLAKKAGMETELKPYPGLALGPFEVTPLEMAQAYTIFPAQGLSSKPLAIRRVVTREGEVLEKKSFESKRVLSPEVAYVMNQLLQGVLDQGTARTVRTKGFGKVAGGKTGTTSDYRDSWFSGFVPDHLALVWVGYDDNESTDLSGASGALPIWVDYMKAVTVGENDFTFSVPKNILRATIDKSTGLLYTSRCSEPIEEYFIEGTEPLEFCDE